MSGGGTSTDEVYAVSGDNAVNFYVVGRSSVRAIYILSHHHHNIFFYLRRLHFVYFLSRSTSIPVKKHVFYRS